MSEAGDNIYQHSISRASVTGKVPGNSKKTAVPRTAAKMAPHQKRHARRLKKRGMISEKAAARFGL